MLGCEDLGDFDCDLCFLAAESLSMDAEADIVCMLGVVGQRCWASISQYVLLYTAAD